MLIAAKKRVNIDREARDLRMRKFTSTAREVLASRDNGRPVEEGP